MAVSTGSRLNRCRGATAAKTSRTFGVASGLGTRLSAMAHVHHDHPPRRDPHGHAHAHAHDHGHAHATGDSSRAFLLGIVLNFGMVVIETVFGLAAHSMALLADAGHNLGDVLGLALAGGAALLAKRAPTGRRTYGFRKLTLVAALANGVLLLVATGAIAAESIRRLGAPEPIAATHVIVVAAAAVVVNGASALLFFGGRHGDLNVKAAFLHLMGDAAIALGVVASAFAVLRTGYVWIDPVASLVVAVLILVSTWSLLRRSLNLVLDAVPDGIDVESVRTFLAALPSVCEVHDLHIWAMSTTEVALTAHLVMPSRASEPSFLSHVCRELRDRFDIDHATLQVDSVEAPTPCVLAHEESV
jgi:cobalt-zinc-cadmium efflux system protein